MLHWIIDAYHASMTQWIGDTDLQELKKLIATTELTAAAGRQRMNATPLSTGHTVYYYVITKRTFMEVFDAHDLIRESSQWAIIHDYYQDIYELWIEGSKFGTLKEHEVLPELTHCMVDPKHR